MPNAETWLDFTDLVFVDPVDTGYSRAVGSGEDVRKRYFSVESDVQYLSAVITRWLRQNNRLTSPKFLVGESYGGFRAPRIAHELQKDIGVGLNGVASGVFALANVLDQRARFGAELLHQLPNLLLLCVGEIELPNRQAELRTTRTPTSPWRPVESRPLAERQPAHEQHGDQHR